MRNRSKHHTEARSESVPLHIELRTGDLISGIATVNVGKLLNIWQRFASLNNLGVVLFPKLILQSAGQTSCVANLPASIIMMFHILIILWTTCHALEELLVDPISKAPLEIKRQSFVRVIQVLIWWCVSLVGQMSS